MFNRAWHKTGGIGLWGSSQAETAGTYTVGPVLGNISGTDSIAFQISMVTGSCVGLPETTNDIAYVIEFRTTRSDAGRHICIDSTSQLGNWQWTSAAFSTKPAWTGRCYELVECCVGTVGDANGDGNAEPTVSDISAIIDFLFITGTPPFCMPEADVNQSGGPNPLAQDITVSDISSLIDHLFITGAPLPPCQ